MANLLEIYVMVALNVGLPLCGIGVDDLLLGVLDDGLAVRTSHCPGWDHHLALAALLAHHDSLLGCLKSRRILLSRRRHLWLRIWISKCKMLCIQAGIM